MLLIINIIIIALAVNVVFIIFASMVVNKKKLRLLKKIGFNNINLQQIKGLEKVKTIIFSKNQLIGTGKYELKKVGHRSTIKEKSVVKIASQLAKLWGSPYTDVLLKKLDEGLEDEKFTIIEKMKDGISVTDENEKTIMLGTYSFVQGFVKKNDNHTLYLIKNKILIGKFIFTEQWNQEGVDVAKKLNQIGNLVYLDSEPENGNSKKLPFDKAYTNLSINEQKTVISKLRKKAKTALFTTDEDLLLKADFDFLITQRADSQPNNSVVNIDFEGLKKIPELISTLRKILTQLKYALSIFIVLNFSVVLYLLLNGTVIHRLFSLS